MRTTPLITYAHIYNRAFGVWTLSSSNRPRLNAWLRARITRARKLSTRARWARGVLLMARTQTLGRHVHPDVRTLAGSVHRLCVIGSLMRIRHLQRRAIRRLWRPGGALMRRECERALRPMQDAE